MSTPPKTPEDARSASTRSAGFWSQECLHMHPHQSQREQAPRQSLTERPPRIEQKRLSIDAQHRQDTPMHQQQPSHTGSFEERRNHQLERPYPYQEYPQGYSMHPNQPSRPIYLEEQQRFNWEQSQHMQQPYRKPPIHQQQPDSTPPARVHPQPYGNPYVQPQPAYVVEDGRTGPTAYFFQPEHTRMEPMVSTSRPFESRVVMNAQHPHAVGDPFVPVGLDLTKSNAGMPPERLSFDQHRTQPCGEPYLQPVRSVEADQAYQPALASNTPRLATTYEQPTGSGSEATGHPKSPPARAPYWPDVDINDDSLPLDVRAKSWRRFRSETAKARNQWEKYGRPPCTTENCRDTSHPPPRRSEKNVAKYRKLEKTGNRLLSTANGRLPCRKCGKIHKVKGVCPAPKCSQCGSCHLDTVSCSLALKKIATAETLYKEREEKRGQRKLQKQQRRQQPLPPPPPPPEMRRSVVHRKTVEMLMNNAPWPAEEFAKFMALCDARRPHLTSMKSEFGKKLREKRGWGADEWAAFEAAYDVEIQKAPGPPQDQVLAQEDAEWENATDSELKIEAVRRVIDCAWEYKLKGKWDAPEWIFEGRKEGEGEGEGESATSMREFAVRRSFGTKTRKRKRAETASD